MNDRYIFLKGEMPLWVSKKLMLFHALDGGIGYELDTGKYNKVIFEGDLLINKGKYIKIVRGGNNEAAKEVD